ncbi:MAG: hypothetical protein CVU60_17285 [Deltaproteobacteria bacterium HGW-Deltaproteobacteria-18]|nr:MAG: hypothetical protein CVU60_17285 [Deltaproteobacteria bacterium HGW-Deltaproteobacteria-18]
MENLQKQALWADAPRFGPGQGRRNSIADLVELNRSMQDGKSGQHARHRFSKRCLAQSDSRCPWPGPTRGAETLQEPTFLNLELISIQAKS